MIILMKPTNNNKTINDTNLPHNLCAYSQNMFGVNDINKNKFSIKCDFIFLDYKNTNEVNELTRFVYSPCVVGAIVPA